MASFNLQKGNKFTIDKGIKNVLIGLGWDIGACGTSFDIDAHAFGCVVDGQGNPSFFNAGSHALTYANSDLKKNGKSFGTEDGSMIHTGDNRSGKGAGNDEEMLIALDKLPPEITEISIFISIHEAKARKQTFGKVTNSFVVLVDQDSQNELCRYNLQQEFSDAITIQVGSLVLEGSAWKFKAVGAGTPDEELGDVLGKLS